MRKFDGVKEAEKIDDEIIERIVIRPFNGELLIIMIGDNASSEKYVDLKVKYCKKLGITAKTVTFPKNISANEAYEQAKTLFNDKSVVGGLIQLPLPNTELSKVLEAIPLEKDLDLLSEKGRALYYASNAVYEPPTVRAVNHFLDFYSVDLLRKKVAIIGAGALVGLPSAKYFLSRGADVYLLDSEEALERASQALPAIKKLSIYKKGFGLDFDVVLTSIGMPAAVDPSDIRMGATVIDFGSSIVDGKTKGDIDYSRGIDHFGAIAASPGGMGPLVIRYLVKNLLQF